MNPEATIKRTRDQLSSSGSDKGHPSKLPNMNNFEKEVSDRLQSIENKLATLDVIQQLLTDIVALKVSVEFTNKRCADLEKKNKELEDDVKKWKETSLNVTKCQTENKKLNTALLDLKCRSMRNNIVITGLDEDPKEDYAITERKVKVFLKDSLKMPDAQIAKMDFQKAHRFGKQTPSKPRSIVACLSHYKMKMAIMEKGPELKGLPLSLNDQYPKEIMDRRRVLIPIMKELRAQHQKVKLVVDRLYVNNQLYRDATTIDWLGLAAD